ncbi:ABC transporter ATP-binding protein [Clostridium sp. 'deep sea']|uniref:ABC transporter ATP-binding protein n=1 Tax=Clostridium sp. 'deep sea' TaxID=2779445 RepID=UPI0018964C0D|nr:ABC transporter ATP-binding protein [Clostridium sp. 'deep sea']QOR34055.1 ABC transporter ATP-binding protein [Clostridium sp. 'deep sea']
MSKALVEVKNLKKYFPITGGVFSKKIGEVKAVDGVSFNINKGEIYGLVGESGCGKSTTGRTILNLLNPTQGSVKFNGKTLYDVEKKVAINKQEMRNLRKDMQIIFQDPFASLDPRMNVGAIISEGLICHKLASKTEALNRARELLELCGLPSSNIKKYPHEFSGGQRQRISIARSLALNPQFIIGDEPIAALDVSVQAQILMLLQDLKEKMDLTYLFISHDLGVIKYFCDKIAVMYLGSFVEVGTSEELFNNPKHPYTKVLLSAMPVIDITQKKERIILQGDVPSPANPPTGCKFHTRCPYAMDICSKEIPKQTKLSESHYYHCHLDQ